MGEVIYVGQKGFVRSWRMRWLGKDCFCFEITARTSHKVEELANTIRERATEGNYVVPWRVENKGRYHGWYRTHGYIVERMTSNAKGDRGETENK